MRRRRVSAALGVAITLSILAAPAANSQESGQPLEFPAGIACTFNLEIDSTDAALKVKEFFDGDGNIVRSITAGRGPTLTFRNADTGEQYSTAPNGTVIRTLQNPDGSTTVELTGHTILIMYPTDIPAGPSTTLYTGRVVLTNTAEGDNVISRLASTAGRKVDICAELSH